MIHHHTQQGGRPTVGSPRCSYCGRAPAEIPGLIEFADEEGFGGGSLGADRWVRSVDHTYNVEMNRFACDDCYIEIGCPSLPLSQGGWRAP